MIEYLLPEKNLKLWKYVVYSNTEADSFNSHYANRHRAKRESRYALKGIRLKGITRKRHHTEGHHAKRHHAERYHEKWHHAESHQVKSHRVERHNTRTHQAKRYQAERGGCLNYIASGTYIPSLPLRKVLMQYLRRAKRELIQQVNNGIEIDCISFHQEAITSFHLEYIVEAHLRSASVFQDGGQVPGVLLITLTN